MRTTTRLGFTAGTAIAATVTLAGTAFAGVSGVHGVHGPSPADYGDTGARHVVFVQTNNPAGNQIAAYRRNPDGTLTPTRLYHTGGRGGMLDGSVADHLASQGSLTYDARHALLYAVNAGSDTVSVFSVEGDHLNLRQVISSGGDFPVSVAVSDDTVYVLNALNGGSVQGYRVAGDRLLRAPGWNRPLGLNPSATPQFTNTPGQVGFSADGRQLLVTTKANTNAVDVFALDRFGAPAAHPVVNTLPGAVPFSFVKHGRDHILLTEAGPNAVATFTVHHDGAITQTAFSATGQAATCWDTVAGDFLYASNAASSTVSGFRIGQHGDLSPLGTTPTDPGTVDSAASEDGRYLYVQTGVNGIVDEFRVNGDGSLTAIGSQTVPGAVGGEGIVAF